MLNLIPMPQETPDPQDDVSTQAAADIVRDMLQEQTDAAPPRRYNRQLARARKIRTMNRQLLDAHVQLDEKDQIITQQDKTIEQHKEEAGIDDLTGIKNRKGLMQAYEALRKSRNLRQNDPKSPGHVLVIDLDKFGDQNESRGHKWGNEVLKNKAEALRRHFRETDTIGRLGGDEFVVYMPGSSLETAVEKAEILRADNEHTETTLSIGVAPFGNNDQGFDDFIHEADVAMFEAKRQGRNRVSILVNGQAQPATETNHPISN